MIIGLPRTNASFSIAVADSSPLRKGHHLANQVRILNLTVIAWTS